LSDQAGDYGRAEIETTINLLFQSERLAFLPLKSRQFANPNDAGALWHFFSVV